jgi:hypothetical protein
MVGLWDHHAVFLGVFTGGGGIWSFEPVDQLSENYIFLQFEAGTTLAPL